MPRIIPRLTKKLQNLASTTTFEPFSLENTRFRGKSLHKPIPPVPSFHPSDYKQSILLVPGNPITSSRDYVHHKSLPPRINTPQHAQKRKNDIYDGPRSMTEEERRWWASPYLRMLSTPLRKCFQTQQMLPSAFLIRLGIFRHPPSGGERTLHPKRIPQAFLMPDGLEHPKFRGRKSGKAGYILCWKNAIGVARNSAMQKRLALKPNMHSLLEDQISHLLKLRLLQELQLVIDALKYQLRYQPKDRDVLVHKPLLRKLTREEWKKFKSTGIMTCAEDEKAIAVIVLPPLNRDPQTKERPQGSLALLSSPPPPLPDASSPEAAPDTPSIPQRPPLPLYTFHSTSEPEPLPSDVHLSQSRIPVYNGVPLFPERESRAALFGLLNRILALERAFRWRNPSLKPSSSDEGGGDSRSIGDKRSSHAFVLLSDSDTALKADMACVGIALWRIAMFEGMGWDEGGERSGWVKRYKYHSEHGNEKYLVIPNNPTSST